MKAFITGICVIAVAYSLLSFFPEDKGAGKMVKFTAAVCFLISLLSLVFSLNMPQLSFENTIPSVNENYKVETEAFRMAIEDMLNKKGINFEKITVGSSENGQNGIIINEITVYGVKEKAECESFIKENTGIDRVIVYE